MLLVLVGPELLRLLAEAPTTKRLQDRGQPRDLGLRGGVRLPEVVDLGFQLQDFAARGLRVRLGLVSASGVGERQRLKCKIACNSDPLRGVFASKTDPL